AHLRRLRETTKPHDITKDFHGCHLHPYGYTICFANIKNHLYKMFLYYSVRSFMVAMPMWISLENCGRFAHFAIVALPATVLAWRRPAELLRQLHQILLGALPLASVAGMALGFVVWIHLHSVVDAANRELVPRFLALAVVLEFAPLGA